MHLKNTLSLIPGLLLALCLSGCSYILGDPLSSAEPPCDGEGACQERSDGDMADQQDLQAPDEGDPSDLMDMGDRPDRDDLSDLPEDQGEGPDLLDQGPPADQGEEEAPPGDQGAELTEDEPELTPRCAGDEDCDAGICVDGQCLLQCDDANPCQETPCAPQSCQQGRCVAGAVICDSPPPPRCDGDAVVTWAAQGACDEGNGQCVYAPNTIDCAQQQVGCQTLTCDPETVTCMPGDPVDDGLACALEGSEGFCRNGQCEQCLTDAHCAASDDPCMSNVCNGFRCVARAVNGASCGDRCQPGQCNSRGECVQGAPLECSSPAFCLEGFCDPDTGCDTRPRENGLTCQRQGERDGVCFGGTCVDCTTDNDCPVHPQSPCYANVCNDNSHLCQEVILARGIPCQEPGFYCDGAGRCVQCEIDGDCDDENVCTTDTCRDDRCFRVPVMLQDFIPHCQTEDGEGGFCSGGACVECRADSDCQVISDDDTRCVVPYCSQGRCEELTLSDGVRCAEQGQAGVCLEGACHTTCAGCEGGDTCAMASCLNGTACGVSYPSCVNALGCARCDQSPTDCVRSTCVLDPFQLESNQQVCVPTLEEDGALCSAEGVEGRCLRGECVPAP